MAKKIFRAALGFVAVLICGLLLKEYLPDAYQVVYVQSPVFFVAAMYGIGIFTGLDSRS